MISNQKINTVKPKRRRILKKNYYLKRFLRKLRKRLIRRWQEIPIIRHHVVKDNSNLKNRLHTPPKKVKRRVVSTTEEEKISRVKTFKVRSQSSSLNINQDFITLKTPPLKFFSVLIKPIRIFTLNCLICKLPPLTKIFYYSEESIQKPRTRPILIINIDIPAYIPGYQYGHTDFYHKPRLILFFNPDFTFLKKHSLFGKNSFNKPMKLEGRERALYLFHELPYNNLSERYLDNIMQQLDNSTADVLKLKEDAKKLKKHLKNSENSQQETEYIHQLQALEEKAKKIESIRIQAMMDIINIDLNSKDSQGKTLAHHLAEYGDFSLLRYLILSKNLNPFIKDNQGFLPKDIANNNKLGITAKHMENTQEFLRSLTPEKWVSHPKLTSPVELNINMRGYFMPRSKSFKETKTTSSSGNGNFSSGNQIPFILGNPYSHSSTDSLIELIEKDKNSDQDLEFLFKFYLSSNTKINFKKTCNEAIFYDKPFYLFIILNCFKNHYPIAPKKDYIPPPLVYAVRSKKLYPFAMLLLCTERFKDLHVTHKPDDYEENVFDIVNRIKESFYIFLLVKKEKNLVNIIDEKYINISKEAIKHTINDQLLNDLYELINLKFDKLKKYIEYSIYEEIPKQNRFLNIRDIISFTEKNIIEIEQDLKELKKTYDLIYQSIKNNNTTNNIYPDPLLSHAPQSNSQTDHPTGGNLTNALASHHSQSSHQASHSTTEQPYSSLSSDHWPAFRSEQSVSQKSQNINSIPHLVNLSFSS